MDLVRWGYLELESATMRVRIQIYTEASLMKDSMPQKNVDIEIHEVPSEHHFRQRVEKSLQEALDYLGIENAMEVRTL